MKRILRFFILLTFMLKAQSALAVSEGRLELKFSTLSFADSSTESLNFQAESHAKYLWQKDRLKVGVNAGVFIASYPEVNFQVPELYLSYKLTDKAHLNLGRAMPKESLFLDSDWGLSVLQSSFRMEPLRPEIQGLTGVHYHYAASKFYVYGMFSPVFIPDQSQTLDRSGSEISSDNPWAGLPPETVIVNGSSFDISYSIENDSLPELLTDLQFGGTMGFNFDNVNVSAFYYYKPSRQLSYSFKARGTSGGNDDDVLVNAEVEPQFLKEHLYGLQAKLDWLPSFTTKHGAYGTVVEDDKLSDNQDYQTEVNDYFIFSNSLTYKWRKGSFTASHIHFNKRDVQQQDVVVYIDFNKYVHGSSVRLEGNYRLKSKLNLIGRALFDYENKGVSLESGFEYRYNKNVSLWSNLQLLHDLDDAKTSSVFEKFDGLDSFRIGAKIVF